MTSRLKEYRKKAGISQNALARACEMHPAHLCQIENGAPTTQRTAEKLSKALGTDPAEVFPEFGTLRKG
jgi:transcriptional regulator with XRE-family HTH domain